MGILSLMIAHREGLIVGAVRFPKVCWQIVKLQKKRIKQHMFYRMRRDRILRRAPENWRG
jgi:hypothetical protein